ncbi:hypothetical protein [Kiloniella majae]|uniref:hypothetical protein n=1 Tax=Kiloniella majae TaxID=1938558 RepID=UPI000A278F8E|nr:hypothetical protein [Kiloniella majae]
MYHSNLIRSFTIRVFASVLLGVMPLEAAYAFQDTGTSSFSQSGYYQFGHSGKSPHSNVTSKKSGQVIISHGYHRPHLKHSYYEKLHKTHKTTYHHNRHHRASGHHHYKKKSYGLHLKSGEKRHYQSQHARRYLKHKRNRQYFPHKQSYPHYGQKHQRYYQN